MTKFFMEIFMESNVFASCIIQRCSTTWRWNERSVWKDKVKRDYKYTGSQKCQKNQEQRDFGRNTIDFVNVSSILQKHQRRALSEEGFFGIYAI